MRSNSAASASEPSSSTATFAPFVGTGSVESSTGCFCRVRAAAAVRDEAFVPPRPQRAVEPLNGVLVPDDDDAPFALKAFLDERRDGGVNRALLDVVEPPLRRQPPLA